MSKTSQLDLYQVDLRTQTTGSIGQGPQGEQERHAPEPERSDAVEVIRGPALQRMRQSSRMLNTASLSTRQLEVETES